MIVNETTKAALRIARQSRKGLALLGMRRLPAHCRARQREEAAVDRLFASMGVSAYSAVRGPLP